MHKDQVPAQSSSTIVAHSPSPSSQSVAAGHSAPAPLRAVVSVKTRAAASSHALVHKDQVPAQSSAPKLDE